MPAFLRLFNVRLVLISAIFIIALFILFNLNRLPRAVDRISRIADVGLRTLKFKLIPAIVVTVGDNTSTKALEAVRRSTAIGPLRVNPANSRYFADPSGRAIYLTGAHTWSNLQDNGLTDPPPAFDYQKYLNFLVGYNHNFFRLWAWEEANWSTETTEDYRFAPLPYERLAQEMALDGKPKFDLNRFNRSYFDRLRQRVIEAGQHGIYVSIMLFNGWSIEEKTIDQSSGAMTPGNPWRGHPYHRDNNVNGIEGDPNNNGGGEEIHTLQIPAVTALQEQYVRKVIDMVNDLDNVLYEISNESQRCSHDWQYHMIRYIKNYEATLPKQHPVGMTVEYPDGDNAKLLSGPADWISPKEDLHNPSAANGRKVILADTDHLCGICGDRRWVWKSFTQGENPLFMDAYDGAHLLFQPPIPPDPLNYEPWISVRRNLGYTLTYANKINLVAMEPRGDLASTGYCLANPVEKGGEYLIYQPLSGAVVVDLSATKGSLSIEWFNPTNGLTISGIKATGGGNRSFIPPFEGDAVLYIHGD
jgi:hypothetical protein